MFVLLPVESLVIVLFVVLLAVLFDVLFDVLFESTVDCDTDTALLEDVLAEFESLDV